MHLIWANNTQRDDDDHHLKFASSWAILLANSCATQIKSGPLVAWGELTWRPTTTTATGTPGGLREHHINKSLMRESHTK